MQRKLIRLVLVISLFGFYQNTNAQLSIYDLNFEVQAYPTGVIPGIRIERGFLYKHVVHFRLGYNWIRHGDQGVHEDERGDGYGFSIGYKYYIKNRFRGLFLGARNDIWFNELDWQDNIDTPDLVSGTSIITVLQPTVEVGYTGEFDNGLIFTPTISFGVEVNARTEGEEVGQGLILLVGLNIGYRF